MGQALYHDGACTCATLANLTQKVGLPGRAIFETKNRAIFLERFFGRGITAREKHSRAVILARF